MRRWRSSPRHATLPRRAESVCACVGRESNPDGCPPHMAAAAVVQPRGLLLGLPPGLPLGLSGQPGGLSLGVVPLDGGP